MSKNSASGHTKAERTRAAILTAARELFADHGYDHTTVRDVAAKAGIDPALVIRYFGSKDDLFALAVEFDLKLPDVAAIASEDIGEALARHFFALWEGPERARGLPLLARSAASNAYAAQKMRDLFQAQVLPALSRAGGRADAGTRASLVASQLMGIVFCRYILRLPPLVQMNTEELVGHIGPTLQRYLRGAV